MGAGESALAGDRRLRLRPQPAGRAVYATCLGDGEQTRWNRSDFIGILREEHLPDWARESLKQIRQKDPAESPDMTTPTM